MNRCQSGRTSRPWPRWPRCPRCILHVRLNEAAWLELSWSDLYIYRTQPGHKKENYRPTKRSRTLLFPPLALITAQICCVISLSSCKFTKFISVQCCVHFSFLTEMLCEDGTSAQGFSAGLSSGLCVGRSTCENDASCSLNHRFIV